MRKMSPAVKIAIAIVLILILAVGGIFIFKKLGGGEVTNPTQGQTQVNPNPPVERPPHKISYLFREGILGKPETDVCEVLDITSDEIIYENILGKNMETTFKWKGGNLEAMYSTVEVTAGIPYDYAREHQVLLDEIIASCDYSPRSSGVIWGCRRRRIRFWVGVLSASHSIARRCSADSSEQSFAQVPRAM